MLEAWQRNMIALARGLVIKPRKQVRYIANVTKLAATPQGAQHMSLFPLEAENELGAARVAAEGCAKAIYGDDADVFASFVQQQENNLFLASVGQCRNGVTTGCTLSILIREYAGGQ